MELENRRILRLALEALYTERDKVTKEIRIIERRLRVRSIAGNLEGVGSKRRLGEAQRRAISAGMKRRWAKRKAAEASPQLSRKRPKA